ncbi:MAG: TPM domain-containing protein [Leptospira sp.]|nr:TPM domain-containing protein [Leptospira sp.]
MIPVLRLSSFCFLLCIIFAPVVEGKEFPPASESVYDEMGFLTTSEIAELKESAERFKIDHKIHVQVYLINSLEGEDVCGYADKILNASQSLNPEYKSVIYLFSLGDNFSCLRFNADLLDHFSDILYDRIYYDHFYFYQTKAMYFDAVRSTQTAFFDILTDSYLNIQKPIPIGSELTRILREANESMDILFGENIRFIFALAFILIYVSLLKFFVLNKSFASKFLFLFLQPLFGFLSFIGFGSFGLLINLGLLFIIPILGIVFSSAGKPKSRPKDNRSKEVNRPKEVYKLKTREVTPTKKDTNFEDPFLRTDTYHTEEENEERFR